MLQLYLLGRSLLSTNHMEACLSEEFLVDLSFWNETLKCLNDLQEVTILGDLINKVAENNLFEWHGRFKLVDCICNFVLLKPEVGQVTILSFFIVHFVIFPPQNLHFFCAVHVVYTFVVHDWETTYDAPRSWLSSSAHPSKKNSCAFSNMGWPPWTIARYLVGSLKAAIQFSLPFCWISLYQFFIVLHFDS